MPVTIFTWTFCRHISPQQPPQFSFLFFFCFSSHCRIFYSYGDVTIASEGLQIWPVLGTHGHWAVIVLYRITPTVTSASVQNRQLRDHVTLISLPNVCNRAVTTCLDDLGLSWPDIELRSPASKANVTPLLMHWNYLT